MGILHISAEGLKGDTLDCQLIMGGPNGRLFVKNYLNQDWGLEIYTHMAMLAREAWAHGISSEIRPGVLPVCKSSGSKIPSL